MVQIVNNHYIMKSLVLLLVLANGLAYSQKSISERLSQKEAKAKTITYLIDASYVNIGSYGNMIVVCNTKNNWVNTLPNYNYRGTFRNCMGTKEDQLNWMKAIKKAVKDAFTKNRLEELKEERLSFTVAFSPQGKPMGVEFFIMTKEQTKLTLEELEDIETNLMRDVKLNFKCQEKITNYNRIPITPTYNLKDLL